MTEADIIFSEKERLFDFQRLHRIKRKQPPPFLLLIVKLLAKNFSDFKKVFQKERDIKFNMRLKPMTIWALLHWCAI